MNDKLGFVEERVQSSDLYSRIFGTPGFVDYIICTLYSVL